MIQSVSSASPVSSVYLQQQQQNPAASKHKAAHKIETRDTVELSQEAQQAAKAQQKSKGS